MRFQFRHEIQHFRRRARTAKKRTNLFSPRTGAIYGSSIRRRLNGFSHDYLCNHQIHTFNLFFFLSLSLFRSSFFRGFVVVRRSLVPALFL